MSTHSGISAGAVSAREAARETNGRFGAQARDEADGGPDALGVEPAGSGAEPTFAFGLGSVERLSLSQTVVRLNSARYGAAGDPGFAREGHEDEEMRDYTLGYEGHRLGLVAAPGYSDALLAGYDDAKGGWEFGASLSEAYDYDAYEDHDEEVYEGYDDVDEGSGRGAVIDDVEGPSAYGSGVVDGEYVPVLSPRRGGALPARPVQDPVRRADGKGTVRREDLSSWTTQDEAKAEIADMLGVGADDRTVDEVFAREYERADGMWFTRKT